MNKSVREKVVVNLSRPVPLPRWKSRSQKFSTIFVHERIQDLELVGALRICDFFSAPPQICKWVGRQRLRWGAYSSLLFLTNKKGILKIIKSMVTFNEGGALMIFLVGCYNWMGRSTPHPCIRLYLSIKSEAFGFYTQQ